MIKHPRPEDVILRQILDNIGLSVNPIKLTNELHVNIDIDRLVRDISNFKELFIQNYKQYTGIQMRSADDIDEIHIHVGEHIIVAERQQEIRQNVVDLGFHVKEKK